MPKIEPDATLPADPESEPTGPGFYIVGIGASTGGLAALRTLFSQVPVATGMAFVVVVHLSPEHESHLVELLQPCTKMPVCQVRETVALEPNRVYVIPPNANLDTIDTHLRLSQLEARRTERAPIDHFLRTLAATHDRGAVGVILTGAGSDGALGLRRIKERGGLTVAQDPAEAEADSMPRSAIATGMVDVVAPLARIAEEIIGFCNTAPRLPVPDADDGVGDGDRALLEQIMSELRSRTGQELAMFRRATLLRRMRTRMQLRHVETLAAYLEALRTVPAEAKALARDLLVTVTEFFAEPRMIEYLELHLLPAIFARKRAAGERLRVWTIGCSSGEEAYSLAMLLLEQAEGREPRPILQVFASDLSEESLKAAREGVYPQEVAASVSTPRLERFFTQEGGHYRVQREVRDVVVFAAHDLFKDPPFGHLDLIVCRDLLCELQPAVARGVLNLLYYALEPHGTLIVGPHDQIHDRALFVRDEAAEHVYRRTMGARPTALPLLMPGPRGSDGATGLPDAGPHIGTRHAAAVFQLAMESHIPASVLIDGANQAIHYSARAGRYVHIPGGALTQDILQLVREPIRSRLEVALPIVRREGKVWRSGRLQVPVEGGRNLIVVHVEPLPMVDSPDWLLVVFEETLPGRAAESPDQHNGASDVIARLQTELDHAHQRMRTLLEVQEANQAERVAGESARAMGEAAQAANDDLRVLVEELQSSREELQAVNEEMLTLDGENRHRLTQLVQVTADLNHLLESTGIATLFIDCDLKIVRFTPQLAELFNVRHTDVGRPIADLTHELNYDELEADACRVLEDLLPVDREVAGAQERWYLSRMSPYRTAAQRVEGVVLTLIDITERKRAEQRLREADRRKDDFLAMLAHELRNPLAPITSGIEILRAASGDRQMIDKVTTMMARQTHQLVRLVDDLLEISRISGGKLRLQKTPVALRGIVNDAIAAMQPVIESLAHQLVVDKPPASVIVDADAVRLTQVIANLLHNAARYTPRGGRIEVGAQMQPGQVIVSVKDNGVGIEADILEHVFDMFYQGGTGRVPSAGLGIGLALAKSLAELHGGTLTAASLGAGRGSEFRLCLPTPAALGVPVPSVGAAHGASRFAGDRRVLIVDDNSDAAESLCTLIQTLGGSDVHTASNGVEALSKGAQLHPEVVLLDLLMPGMDGFEVGRRIRAEQWGREVMLVALTGWGLEDHRRRSREAGFDSHLTKPVDLEALSSVLAARHVPGPPVPEPRTA